MPRFLNGSGRLSTVERPPAAPAARSVFLDRASYRLRRLHDAARLAPVAGVLLWLLPLLWPRETTSISTPLVYTFAIWLLLIAASALLSRALRRSARAARAEAEARAAATPKR